MKISEHIKDESYRRMDNDTAFITDNSYLLEESKYDFLKSYIMAHLVVYTQTILNLPSKYEFYMQNSWGVLFRPDMVGRTHVHENSLISGVYYLDVPKDSGAILFETPHMHGMFPNAIRLTPADDSGDNIYNCHTYGIMPKKEGILLFPSHLPHRINKNESNQNRYSLGFNFFVRGTISIGSGESVLKLL